MFNPLSIFKRKPDLKSIRLICFDLDNTLYDYGIAEAQAEAHLAEMISKDAKKHKKMIRPTDVLDAFNTVKRSHMHHDLEPEKFSRSLWFKETLEKLGMNCSDLSARRYEKEYWNHLAPRVVLFPGTEKTLAKLKNSGYKIATITDSDGKKEIKLARLKATGLDTYFDYIITTDDTHKNKPSIENWEYLLKISGFKGDECMMVGDHPDVDLINAKNLGFATVWTQEHIKSDIKYPYADFTILNVAEILKILGR